MKIAIRNYNGILDTFIEYIKSKGEFEENYHNADILVTWQDVRGEEKELVEIFKNRLNKPVVVVEHGRGATRDYCIPNNFPLLADKICVWGQKSINRLLKAKLDKNRVELTGCPLLKRVKKRNKKDFINVLFCPVISTKEEPENILVYAALKKWESSKLISNIYDNFDAMKRGWATKEFVWKDIVHPDGKIEKKLWSEDIVPRIPRSITYKKGFVHVKNTPIHDTQQYLAPVIMSPQNDIEPVLNLLVDIDLVVCLEESTLPLLATAMSIPVVVCDIFQWKEYGGCKDYDKIEQIYSPSSFRCDLISLGKTISRALEKGESLELGRISTIEEEMGGDLALSADQNIYEVVKSLIPEKQLITA